MVSPTTEPVMLPILLASSSTYRRELLSRLGLRFEYAAPDVDETPRPDETATELVARLSESKAKVFAASRPNSLIIGSDQVATLDDAIIGKPNSPEQAFNQLRAASGRTLIFKTGLCVFNTATGRTQLAVEEFNVHFRTLNDEQIQRYLAYEQPYDCAGSFKCEGLGIALFTKLEGDDPTALIGLPLIRLTQMLANEGLDPLLEAMPAQ